MHRKQKKKALQRRSRFSVRKEEGRGRAGNSIEEGGEERDKRYCLSRKKRVRLD